MRKSSKISAIVMITLVTASFMGSASVLTVEKQSTYSPTTFVNETVNITYPLVGYLSAYGGQIPLEILERHGWGVQIDRDFGIKANTTGDVDKVVFTIENRKGDIYELNDTEAPWEVSFDVRTHAYNITATAYYMDAMVAQDVEGPIFYLQGLIKPPS